MKCEKYNIFILVQHGDKLQFMRLFYTPRFLLASNSENKNLRDELIIVE